MPAAGHNPAHPTPAEPPRSDRQALMAAWAHALRQRADAATLQTLAPLTDAEAARVMALLRDGAAQATPAGPTPSDSGPGS